MSLSFLLYDHRFAPLDYWRQVFPGVQLREAADSVPGPQPGALLWLSADVPDWQAVSQQWSGAGGKVLVLTRQPHPAEMNLALASGARAYLPALSNARVVRQASESVNSGGLWFSQDLLGALLRLLSGALDTTGAAAEVDLSMLTTREQEVARSAAKGDSNQQIAESLGITQRTVKEHMGSVFRKLGVKDRMQLMLLITGQRVPGGGEHVR